MDPTFKGITTKTQVQIDVVGWMEEMDPTFKGITTGTTLEL